jgi:hypothetical protein
MGKAFRRYLLEPVAYGLMPLILLGALSIGAHNLYWKHTAYSTVRGRLEEKAPLETSHNAFFSEGYTIRVSDYPHDIVVWGDEWDKTAEMGDMLDLEVIDSPVGEKKICLGMDDGK